MPSSEQNRTRNRRVATELARPHAAGPAQEERAAALLGVADAEDAQAGIHRVSLAEAIERAARLDFDDARIMSYGHGPTWDAAPEAKRQSSRDRVARVVKAALGL